VVVAVVVEVISSSRNCSCISYSSICNVSSRVVHAYVPFCFVQVIGIFHVIDIKGCFFIVRLL
jgi:hypothetical protein